ncbi:hypothetical protein BCV69DRAFT_313645 [Microstroma glucosiphilum]|uniref:Fungal-type protein kinase domain-containing protein n=1 Tax=Pseudomicrostroma glucosiphilum TaxID=1684307 RepID=A0A316U2F3_9BASI|nr:hypothetical protein BCV69DRAFT_313645 [Pseudomicrostroma glucosiphilum]PWN19380.1 hypothetical protein BCV69DRAFT_313645 [Pseudomicrostroma glucosiphilum]
MSTISSTKRPRSESAAEPSNPRESCPEYRSFFGPATETTSTKDNTEIRQKYLLPDVLLGTSAEQRKSAFQEVSLPSGTYEYTGSPPTSSSSTATRMLSEGVKEIEKHIEADANDRHYAGLYEMQTNAAVDQCASEPGTVAPGGVSSIQLTGLESLDVRPGPSKSRTPVFVDHGVGSRSTIPMLMKTSWQSSRLCSDELRMAFEVWRLSKKCELPFPPESLGLAEVPIPDFQTDNSEPLTTSGPGPHFPPRTVCVLMFRQPLGDMIGSQVLPHDLVHLHMELADQLLTLATHEFHYRDLNEGLLRDSDNTLLIIDWGKMRGNLSPRRQSGLTDAEATIDRATDDTRSANPLFLPTCSLKVASAIHSWNGAVTTASVDFQEALDTGAGHRAGLDSILARLAGLRNPLKKLAVHGHRHIDDLESAVFLHFWRMAYCGPSTPEPREFSALLQFGVKMQNLWSSDGNWTPVLRQYCSKAGREWIKLMRDLRDTIYNARVALDQSLSDSFEKQAKLNLDRLEVELLTLPWNNHQDVKHNLYSLFENRHLFDESRLNEIERKCFKKCSELLRNAEIAIKARRL